MPGRRLLEQAMSKWRGAKNIGLDTDGSRKLLQPHGKRNWPKVRPRFWFKLRSPETSAKIVTA